MERWVTLRFHESTCCCWTVMRKFSLNIQTEKFSFEYQDYPIKKYLGWIVVDMDYKDIYYNIVCPEVTRKISGCIKWMKI